jgi:hypothetical protein
MFVYSSLNMTYWSDIEHGVSSVIIKSDVVLKVAGFLSQHKSNTKSTDKQKKFHFFNTSRSTTHSHIFIWIWA